MKKTKIIGNYNDHWHYNKKKLEFDKKSEKHKFARAEKTNWITYKEPEKVTRPN